MKSETYTRETTSFQRLSIAVEQAVRSAAPFSNGDAMMVGMLLAVGAARQASNDGETGKAEWMAMAEGIWTRAIERGK